MKRFLNGIRWFIAIILIIPLFVFLLGGSAVVSLSQTVSTPETPKQWLKEGQVYENAVSIGIEQILAQVDENNEDNQSIETLTQGLITEQEAKDIAIRVFPPEWIETEAEAVIDSAYSFLNKETESLEISINLTEVNEKAKTELITVFKNKIKELPICSYNNQITLSEFDLMTADCLPQGISMSQIDQTLNGEVETIPFLNKTAITSDDLDLEKLENSNIGTVFSAIKMAPIGIVFIALTISFLVFLVPPKLRNKLKLVGYTWLAAGLFVVTAAILARSFISDVVVRIVLDFITASSSIVSFIQPAIELAYKDIASQLLIVGAIVVGFGVLLVITSLFTKRK